MKTTIGHRLTFISRSAAYFAIALGLLVLGGWAFDITWAKSIHPSWSPMRANTALCFFLSGTALLLLQRTRATNVSKALGIIIGVLGALNLAQYFLHVDFGIDQLLVTQGTQGVGTLSPGRMPSNTSVNFIFVGLALFFPDAEIRNRVRVAEVLALLVGLLALPTLIGYLYGANFHAALTVYVQMAFHAAAGFIILALGLLCLRPERGLARLWSSGYAGGVQARGLIPYIVMFPLAIGGFSLIGIKLELYDIRFAMTLTIMVTIAVLLNRASHLGLLLDTLDRQREEAVSKLLIANRDLEEQVQKRTGELILVKKMAALGEMAGGIAHELNTPLGSLSMSTESLRTELEEYSEKLGPAFETIESIETTTERMAQVVRGLLVFAREGSKDKKTEQNLLQVVRDTGALCSQKFESYKIKLVLSEPKAPVLVDCRPAELSHALLNLLSNAFDACVNTTTPEVRVDIETQGLRAIISVTDSGPRISNDLAEKIMQPFFTTKAVGNGTGLGLSIAKGFIESHDGELFLDRTADKTRFVINLPLSSARI